MKSKQNIRDLTKNVKTYINLKIICIVLIVAILVSLFLFSTWNRYGEMAEIGAKDLAQSIGAIMHVDHIEGMGEEADDQDSLLVHQSLEGLVENTESIYYAYLLKEEMGDIKVIADSSAADSSSSQPTMTSCEGTVEGNRVPFETGESFITESISTPCGNRIRVLTPIFNPNTGDIVTVLGLSYSSYEWYTGIWKSMIPHIIIAAFMVILAFMIINLFRKNSKYKEAEESRQESERSKSVFFSQLPGMAYRCKDNINWTIEFVSEGCYELTGYKPESLISDKEVSYRQIVSPEYREPVRAEWKRVLMEQKEYRDEYEIITKSGERKWVFELGKGIYDKDGNVIALEGIVLDISEQRKKDYQITYLKERDFLTGLYNRTYMEKEKNRLDRFEFWPLSILICDIDGLRVINDAYSHKDGDYLIVKTAQLIQNCLGDEYVLGHRGGGEFIILLPNTDSKLADQLRMDITNSIATYNRANDKKLYTISLSIGFSTKEREDQDIQAVTIEAEEHMRRRKMLNQNSSHSDIVSSVMASLYAKSQETEEHGQRLGKLCLMIGRELGLSQLELDDLQLLSKLHDIGKIGIDDHILNKSSKLSEDEWKIMKKHPEIGYRIAMTTPQLEHIAKYILYHHERWDGRGYPKGLEGEEIPVLSRILAIADAFDAMTEDRVYRKALSEEDAIKEIENNAGTQFDPYIAKIFLAILRKGD